MKRVVEQREILRTMNEQRAQRDVEVRAPADVHELERPGDVDHARRGDIQSRSVQQLTEMQEVVEKIHV